MGEDRKTLVASAAPSPVVVADAVARVWIVGLMKSRDMAWAAHPLACVRAALAGETDPVELGCDPAKLSAALRTNDVEELRAALSPEETKP